MLASGEGCFPGRWILGDDRSFLLLLLADNYNRTTNDLTTEAQRTHRDFVAERSDAVHQLADPCGPPAAAPVSRRAALCAARVPAARVRLGRPGLRGCRQGGGIAWQALVSGGRSPVGPEETEPFLLKEVIVQ